MCTNMAYHKSVFGIISAPWILMFWFALSTSRIPHGPLALSFLILTLPPRLLNFLTPLLMTSSDYSKTKPGAKRIN